MRQKANIYLPPELLTRYQAEAERDGLSLSAHLVRRLSMREQINELQNWMAGRFDRVDDRLDRVSMPTSDDRLLALVGLEKLPREVLLGVLRDVKEELAKLNTKQREHYSAKGRELLARTNGAAK
jgi:hypothetical protein